MVRVIANAVRQRMRVPEHDVTIRMQDGAQVTVTAAQLADARRGVPRNGTFHANREPFLRRVLDALSPRSRPLARRGPARSRRAPGPAVRPRRRHGGPPDPQPHVAADDARSDSCAGSCPIRRRCRRQPTACSRPSSSGPSCDRRTRPGPSTTCPCSTRRPSASAAPADPGPCGAARRRRLRRARRRRPVRARYRPSTTVAERAMADRTWIYGHVVVDEAQELSRMAWHALSRRCSRRSMTVVGDLQQTTHPAGARDWDEALSWAGDRVDLHTLTVTYRITRQTADTATALLTGAGGTAPDLQPIREGAPTERLSCTRRRAWPPSSSSGTTRTRGRIGVIVPDDRAAELMAAAGRRRTRVRHRRRGDRLPDRRAHGPRRQGPGVRPCLRGGPGCDRRAGAPGVRRLRGLHPRHADPPPRAPVITPVSPLS